MKRQFIAGAKCPQCGALDRVVKIVTADDEWMECIDCAYSEKRPTHVEPSEPTKPDEVGVIQFKPRHVV